MNINNAVVHKISKVLKDDGKYLTSVTPSGGELVVDENLTSLIRALLDKYNNRSTRYFGSFESNIDYYKFSSNLNSFLSQDINFFDFSIKALARLEIIVGKVHFAIGGYLLLVNYESNGRRYFLVAKLNVEDGKFFSADMKNVVPSSYLSVDKLQVAARVDLDSWYAQENKYLSFILKKDADKPSDYFKEFVGCTIDQDSVEESMKFVSVVKDFAKKIALDKPRNKEILFTLQKRVFDYYESIRKTENNTIDSFSEIGNLIYPENPDLFLEFLNAHPSCPSPGFIPDRTQMKKLSNINYTSGEFVIKMSYEFKMQHVSIRNGNLIIKNPPEELINEITAG